MVARRGGRGTEAGQRNLLRPRSLQRRRRRPASRAEPRPGSDELALGEVRPPRRTSIRSSRARENRVPLVSTSTGRTCDSSKSSCGMSGTRKGSPPVMPTWVNPTSAASRASSSMCAGSSSRRATLRPRLGEAVGADQGQRRHARPGELPQGRRVCARAAQARHCRPHRHHGRAGGRRRPRAAVHAAPRSRRQRRRPRRAPDHSARPRRHRGAGGGGPLPGPRTRADDHRRRRLLVAVRADRPGWRPPPARRRSQRSSPIRDCRGRQRATRPARSRRASTHRTPARRSRSSRPPRCRRR